MAVKTSLKKWFRVLWNARGVIPTWSRIPRQKCPSSKNKNKGENRTFLQVTRSTCSTKVFLDPCRVFYRASRRKALLAGCYTLGNRHQALASSSIKLMVPSVATEAQIRLGTVTSLKWSPLITFDAFRDPPSMYSYPKQIWVVPPLNPSKVFSDPPFFPLKSRDPSRNPPPPPGDK